MARLRAALISCIVPGVTSGTNPVLNRHLQDSTEIDWLVISDGPVRDFPHVVLRHPMRTRLLKRLGQWGNDLLELMLPCDWRGAARACDEFHPDVILTVAHGQFPRLALWQARSRRVPLITIFHDWWPDLAPTHRRMRRTMDRHFRKLHQSSKISLSVCEGMLSHLGPHPGAQVMYPIPSGSLETRGGNGSYPSMTIPLKVIYMGNLGDYGHMVRAALEATRGHPGIRMEVCGRHPSWPDAFGKEVKHRGQWLDFLANDELATWLDTAGIFLVAMRFEPEHRRFMETSFPSKITHYAQFHKPIIVWGPDYCSAVRWARTTGRALCVTERDPAALVRAIETLGQADYCRWAGQARQAAEHEFNPVTIQQQFLGALAIACNPNRAFV